MEISLRRQRGATLVIGLIMLVLLTLMAVSSFNLGKSSLQIVGNMQYRSETLRAAEQAVETAISTPTALTVPSNSSVDVNGDGVPDVTVGITPILVQAYVLKNNALNLNDANEVGCSLGTAQSFGVAGSATGNSLCAQVTYDLKAMSTEAATNTSVELHQGVALQVPADKVCALVPC